MLVDTEMQTVGVRALCACVALCSMISGCGSKVVVAEQAKHSDASQFGPEGGRIDETEQDAGDTTHITLCGDARCKDLAVVIPGTGTVTGYACCPEPGQPKCGVVEVTQCVQLNYPGHLDPSCRSPLSGLDFPGCCRPDGTCGVLDTQFGLGCAQLPFVPASLMGTCMY